MIFNMVLTQTNQKKVKYIIGIDDAGLRALAGPVAVGVIVIPESVRSSVLHTFDGVKGYSLAQGE